jgi:hypothetical protein
MAVGLGALRAERGSAGIPDVSRLFDLGDAGIAGHRRERPATSRGMSAGCGVASIANAAAYARDAVVVRAAKLGKHRSQWRWLSTAMNLCRPACRA